MKKWLQWLFRRGTRGSLLLNMQPGDEIVAMTSYREWLVLVSKRGEVYMISADEFGTLSIDDARHATVHRVTP